MSAAYTLTSGLAIAFGFILSLIALTRLMVGESGSIPLVIGLLVLILGLQSWQYISTLVQLEEVSDEITDLHNQLDTS